MTRSFFLAIIVVSAILPVSAQESASPAKLSFIAGTVVTEPGSEPLKKALVQIVGEDQKQGGNYTTLTDGEGHFRVEQVLPGRYQIFVERAGFVGVNERGLKADTNLFTVRAGQPLEDVIFRMLPTAVISGRVTDEDGDPMPAVAVIIQKKKAGRPTRETVGSGTTNDLGDYRVAGLFPGQYWIVALPPPDFRDYERQQKSADDDSKASGARSPLYHHLLSGHLRCLPGSARDAQGGRRNAGQPHAGAGADLLCARHGDGRSRRPKAGSRVVLQSGRLNPRECKRRRTGRPIRNTRSAAGFV